MCIEGDIEKVVALIVDNIAIYKIGKDSNVFESSKYNKDVWLF